MTIKPGYRFLSFILDLNLYEALLTRFFAFFRKIVSYAVGGDRCGRM